jgi:hypothetical protein
MSEIENSIRSAILGKKVVEFDYHGYHRIAEIHIFGIHNGEIKIQVYQIRGETSSGGLPEWRTMEISQISKLEITNKTFAPRLSPTGEPNAFDEVFLTADC